MIIMLSPSYDEAVAVHTCSPVVLPTHSAAIILLNYFSLKI